MAGKREARLWQMLGGSFIAGGAVPLAIQIQIVTRTTQVDAEALRLGMCCSFMVLAGIAALVAGRVVNCLELHDAPKYSWVWTPLAFIGMPLGALIFEFEWERTLTMAATLNQKAVLLAAAFVFAAGLVAMVGERIVHHTRSVAASRAQSVLQRADIASRLVRIS